MNHVIVNNLYILIVGQDTSKKPKHRLDWLLRAGLRFVIALLPILAAFGVANLVYVIKYAGLIGFICFFFPSLLQLTSIRLCKKKFSTVHVSVSGSHSRENSDEYKKGEISPQLEKEQHSLLNATLKDTSSLYMTPYSNRITSHPIGVCVVGLVSFFLFLAALSSLFVHPRKLTCEMLVESQ